jgi:hypothetical protein
MSLTLTLKDKAKQKKIPRHFIFAFKKREEVYGVYKMVTLFYKKVCTKIGLSQKPSHHQLWRIFCVLPLIYLQWKKIFLFFFFLLLLSFQLNPACDVCNFFFFYPPHVMRQSGIDFKLLSMMSTRIIGLFLFFLHLHFLFFLF